MLPDTWYTASPEWSLFIIPYFFIGGIAGGSYFIAAALHWLGRPHDRPIVRIGYVVAALGAIISGLLLIVDLHRPLRFWHMLFQSERFPLPVFKPWSPMSIGSWALFLFGAIATLSAIGALADDGRIRWRNLRVLYDSTLGKILALFGAAFGFFVASYTGVLLAVSNRPIWADTQFLGVLFLTSAASTAAATLILLALWRRETRADASTVEFLTWFDGWALILELVVLAFFLLSLGSVASVWLSWRGIVLLLFVVVLGILIPLTLHLRPNFMGERWRGNRIAIGAVLVLIGGFMLRFIILIGSETIHGPHSGVQMTSTVPWP
ncbi:MAG TPA: NrfD/PsrC family molybdoenzyme membrane anchor subunit [Longimicrobiales bacterium]|nr:NrfD/PsrC family molybdoenzyme membrane anchor subunit [Longimicrobiales bacterium]